MTPGQSLALLAALGAAAFVAARPKKYGKGNGEASLPFPEPEVFKGVPFAQGDPFAVWPVDSTDSRKYDVSYKDINGKIHANALRRFGAPRQGEKGPRYHIGIDLYANDGDVVKAVEDGFIVEDQTFKLGSWALLQQGNSGVTNLYGEVKKNSWQEFGVQKGSFVKKGDPIARVALMVNNQGEKSHMLHFETYTKGVTENIPWYTEQKKAPPEILNPTRFLLKIAARENAAVA